MFQKGNCMKRIFTLLLLFIGLGITAKAQDFEYSKKGQRVIEETPLSTDVARPERFSIHFQTTYIYQYKPKFSSDYQGRNSLDSAEQKDNSVTATLYLGLRLWKGGELYVNPEIAGGSGLSGALGMAGSSNGETFRVGNPSPTLYLARGYIQQTFALKQNAMRRKGVLNTQSVDADANQLAGYEPKNYLRFIAGKYCLGDYFDNNEYSNSPRTQFMNWALMNNGAWDYAANVRGYTLAFTTELQLGNTNVKANIAAMPEVANGAKLNTNINQAYSLNAEVNHHFNLWNKPGNLRLLGFYNKANMGNYQDAINIANSLSKTPYVDAAAIGYNGKKYGFGINFDQELSKTFGVFGRLGWNDGRYQTWCFTEIDQTVTLGLSANGGAWKRTNDNCGLAFILNGLSQDHKDYLAMGGYGFILGDGALNYAPEFITELYYSFKPVKQGIWITGDYQFCMNPGYNMDRGPVHILSARVHVEL